MSNVSYGWSETGSRRSVGIRCGGRLPKESPRGMQFASVDVGDLFETNAKLGDGNPWSKMKREHRGNHSSVLLLVEQAL